jgi:hypothetical protein
LNDRINEIGAIAAKMEGGLDPKAGSFLYRLARFHAPASAIVGLENFQLRSTIWLASAVRDRGDTEGRHWAVGASTGSPKEDLEQQSSESPLTHPRFDELCAILRSTRMDKYVEMTREDTIEASRRWPVDRQIGLLFIAASHGYQSVLRDFEFWSPFVALGGYVVFDRVPSRPGPTRFTSELPKWYEFVGASDGIWVVRKSPAGST